MPTCTLSALRYATRYDLIVSEIERCERKRKGNERRGVSGPCFEWGNFLCCIRQRGFALNHPSKIYNEQFEFVVYRAYPVHFLRDVVCFNIFWDLSCVLCSSLLKWITSYRTYR